MKQKFLSVPYIKHKHRLIVSPKIVPFTGFGNKDQVLISGMVVEENGISKPEKNLSRWSNLKSMVKRYVANELEGVPVEITFNNVTKVVITDKYGIFRCDFSNGFQYEYTTWHKASIMLPGSGHISPIKAEEEVMIVGNNPQFGIISDIDDTILVSYATQKLMKLRLMLLNNAHTRMPFEGVAAFYEALQNGVSVNGLNPIFYVSNSEWNLYDLLYEFIQFNRIPKGPMLLREMAIRVLRPWKLREVNKNHKKEVISKLFEMYPELKFILIGDSGQKDPEVYSEIVSLFPGRIPAIYIRDVGIVEKMPRIKILSQLVLNEFSTEMVLVKDTEGAAMHAIEKGFISPGYFEPVLKEKQKDIALRQKPAERLI